MRGIFQPTSHHRTLGFLQFHVFSSTISISH
jgi:hypothetical protein